MPSENIATSTPKIALVTGGSRGIGRATVLSLAQRDVNTIFTYNTQQAEAATVVGLVAQNGRQAIALPLDTGNISSFDPFVQRVRQALAELGAERFDYLVNNAGISLHNAFDHTTEEELDSVYTINFKGVFFLTQKLLRLINDGGRIVNISSGLTRFTIPGSSAYAAMKGAIEVLTRYMAKELGGRDIAVNTVAPGAIATDFSGGVVRDNPEMNRRVAGMTALGRVGQPEDVGSVIAVLLSEDCRWIDAQRLEVSGGMAL